MRHNTGEDEALEKHVDSNDRWTIPPRREDARDRADLTRVQGRL